MSQAFKKAVSFVLALTACAGMLPGNAVIPAFSGLTAAAAAEDEEPEGFSIDRQFVKVGDKLKFKNADGYTLRLFVGDDETGYDPAEFTLDEAYLEQWITVRAYEEGSVEAAAEDKIWFSRLPVVYINTDEGAMPPPEDKSVKVEGDMFIQNNESCKKAVYDGRITLQGRGNTTWGWAKKPYKIKLDEKTDILGMGKSKKWVLLANYQDESLLRNTTAAKLSMELGLETMDTRWTEVILNGEYAGNYQLCEQVGIEKTRVNIIDWESEAEDAADAIAEQNGFTDKQTSNLEKQMVKDLSWLSSDTVRFGDTDYTVSDYYEYSTDLTGGYLFESSEEYDEESKFMLHEVELDEYVDEDDGETAEQEEQKSLKIMMKSPEYLNTNEDMWDYVQQYWKHFEDACCSEDGYTVFNDEVLHYTDLADFDSMVSYWLLMEIMGNDDARYKSRYIYKEQGGKLTFGPPWDFDTGAGSILVSRDISDEATGWKVSLYDDPQNFYREFLDDPYFAVAAAEKYRAIRPYLESVIEPGGQLETDSKYLNESGEADSNRWNRSEEWGNFARGYENDRDFFIDYMRERIAWLDEQFATVDTLMESTRTNSASPYTKSDGLELYVENADPDESTNIAPADAVIEAGSDFSLVVNATYPEAEAIGLDYYINGRQIFSFGPEPVSSDNPEIWVGYELAADCLTAEIGTQNVISVIARDGSGNTLGRNFITVVEQEKPAEMPAFQKHNVVLSGMIGVNFFVNLDALTEEEKADCRMDFTLNGKTFSDTFDENFMNQTGEFYGFTCYVTSVEMADKITAVFSWGDGNTISEEYSVLDYINKVEENADDFDAESLALVRSIADYGHYAQPMLAQTNGWTIGTDYAEMDKFYTENYNYDEFAEASAAYERTCTGEDADIAEITNTVALDADTSLIFFIRPAEDYTGFVRVLLGEDELETVNTGGRYRVIIPNIQAHELGTAYTLTIETEHGSVIFTASALSYVRAILTSEKYADETEENAAVKNAVCAFFNYFTATMAYREVH